jgi:hypothetical protein
LISCNFTWSSIEKFLFCLWSELFAVPVSESARSGACFYPSVIFRSSSVLDVRFIFPAARSPALIFLLKVFPFRSVRTPRLRFQQEVRVSLRSVLFCRPNSVQFALRSVPSQSLPLENCCSGLSSRVRLGAALIFFLVYPSAPACKECRLFPLEFSSDLYDFWFGLYSF